MRKSMIFCLAIVLIFSFSAGELKAEENHPPELLYALYLVHNVLRWPDPIVVVTVEESEYLAIMFYYADEDCNLAGGHFYVRQIEPEETDWEDLGVLPDEIKCSSSPEEDGIIYGFGFSGALEPDYYSGETKWTDVLGAESNAMPWEFEVVEGDDDDDDTDDDIDDDTDDDTDDDSDDDDSDDDSGGDDGGCGCF